MLGQDNFFVVILSVIIIIIFCGKEEHFIDSQIDKFFFLEDQNGKRYQKIYMNYTSVKNILSCKKNYFTYIYFL